MAATEKADGSGNLVFGWVGCRLFLCRAPLGKGRPRPFIHSRGTRVSHEVPGERRVLLAWDRGAGAAAGSSAFPSPGAALGAFSELVGRVYSS